MIKEQDIKTRTISPPAQSDENLEAFETFWKTYPRPEAKAPAKKKWLTLTQNGVSPETLQAGAEAYARKMKDEKREKKFILLPTTWLNQLRWEDEIQDRKPTPRRAQSTRKHLRREDYEAAGKPNGDTEEGIWKWVAEQKGKVE